MNILEKMFVDNGEPETECRGIDKSASDAGHRVCTCRLPISASSKLNRRKQRYVTEARQINTAASEMLEEDRDKLFHKTKKTRNPRQIRRATPPRRRRSKLVEIGWPRAQRKRRISIPLAICSIFVLMLAVGAWFQCQGSGLGECQ